MGLFAAASKGIANAFAQAQVHAQHCRAPEKAYPSFDQRTASAHLSPSGVWPISAGLATTIISRWFTMAGFSHHPEALWAP